MPTKKVETKKVETKEEVKAGKVLDKKELTKIALSKQKKVKVIIPKEATETEGAYETVQINGYIFQIKKGVYVDVPEQVAEIIMEATKQTEEAHRKAMETIPQDQRMEFDNR